MKFHRSALSALALLVALPLLPAVGSGAARIAGLPGVATAMDEVGAARAAIIRRNKIQRQGTTGYRLVAVGDADNEVSGVIATIKSDVGDEDLTLVETNAWLHGAAPITTLPAAGATLSLTLYDSGSASMMSFSGRIDSDGAVALSADATSSADCATRSGCADDDTSSTGPDVELLAAGFFYADASFGTDSTYELSFDLAGADTWSIAYGEVTITESGDAGGTCTSRLCDPTAEGTILTSEVGWDEIGAVWEGDLTLEPEGLIDVKMKTLGDNGRTLESLKYAVGAPWLDGGEGISVLTLDDDPLTTLGFALSRFGGFDDVQFNCATCPSRSARILVLSEGWTEADSIPAEAQVELNNGETVTVPVNSYQRRQRAELRFGEGTEVYAIRNPTFSIGLNGRLLTVEGRSPDLDDLASPLCAEGTCVGLTTDEEGGYQLSVSSYGVDAALTGEEIVVTVALLDDDGQELSNDTFDVAFDDEIAVLFASPVCFGEDPIGLDLSGEVSLLDAPDSKGKQHTLAKGKFYGAFSRDGDGDLELAGAERNNTDPSRGDAVCVGEGPELSEGGGDDPPPVTVLAHFGKGTKSSASAASTKPELL